MTAESRPGKFFRRHDDSSAADPAALPLSMSGCSRAGSDGVTRITKARCQVAPLLTPGRTPVRRHGLSCWQCVICRQLAAVASHHLFGVTVGRLRGGWQHADYRRWPKPGAERLEGIRGTPRSIAEIIKRRRFATAASAIGNCNAPAR